MISAKSHQMLSKAKFHLSESESDSCSSALFKIDPYEPFRRFRVLVVCNQEIGNIAHELLWNTTAFWPKTLVLSNEEELPTLIDKSSKLELPKAVLEYNGFGPISLPHLLVVVFPMHLNDCDQLPQWMHEILRKILETDQFLAGGDLHPPVLPCIFPAFFKICNSQWSCDGRCSSNFLDMFVQINQTDNGYTIKLGAKIITQFFNSIGVALTELTFHTETILLRRNKMSIMNVNDCLYYYLDRISRLLVLITNAVFSNSCIWVATLKTPLESIGDFLIRAWTEHLSISPIKEQFFSITAIYERLEEIVSVLSKFQCLSKDYAKVFSLTHCLEEILHPFGDLILQHLKICLNIIKEENSPFTTADMERCIILMRTFERWKKENFRSLSPAFLWKYFMCKTVVLTTLNTIFISPPSKVSEEFILYRTRFSQMAYDLCLLNNRHISISSDFVTRSDKERKSLFTWLCSATGLAYHVLCSLHSLGFKTSILGRESSTNFLPLLYYFKDLRIPGIDSINASNLWLIDLILQHLDDFFTESLQKIYGLRLKIDAIEYGSNDMNINFNGISKWALNFLPEEMQNKAVIKLHDLKRYWIANSQYPSDTQRKVIFNILPMPDVFSKSNSLCSLDRLYTCEGKENQAKILKQLTRSNTELAAENEDTSSLPGQALRLYLRSMFELPSLHSLTLFSRFDEGIHPDESVNDENYESDDAALENIRIPISPERSITPNPLRCAEFSTASRESSLNMEHSSFMEE